MHSSIALIQEPYIYKDIIRELDENTCSIFVKAGVVKPRTCVALSKSLNAILLPQFCDRDLTVIQIKLESKGNPVKVIMASAYLPYDSRTAPPSNLLEELVNHCKAGSIPLIVGCDANAHHTVWGSSNINSRGTHLLEFIVSKNMEILNKGSEATFRNARRSEVIDLTLCTQNFKELVHDWHVSKEETLSDHAAIIFEIRDRVQTFKLVRNPKKTDWSVYSEKLKISLANCQSLVTSKTELDSAVTELNKAIITAFELACPMRRLKFQKCPIWWNKDLNKFRIEVKSLHRTAKASNSNEDWLSYRNKRKVYKSSLRKSKRESWKTFCSKIDGEPSSGRLQKILTKRGAITPSMLKLPNGDFTSSEDEVVSILLDTHFNGNATGDTNSPDTIALEWSNIDHNLVKEIVTIEKVEWAINSFSPFKTAGEDKIFPALLQKGGFCLIHKLVDVISASLLLGYIPSDWTKVNISFIPKVGRSDYSSAKSFRPISLSSFLLKTVERLVDRFLRDRHLNEGTLSANQHAYRAGKSTESALHQLVSNIESSLLSKESSLVSFIDIEGAFDNTSFNAIIKTLKDRGINNLINRWIFKMLSTRKLSACLFEHAKKSITVRKGCPQGSVLSPLLWIAVADNLLKELKSAGFSAHGYADDIAITVNGKFFSTLCDRQQSAFKIIEHWCKKTGVSVNPDKVKLILFTKKRRVEGLFKRQRDTICNRNKASRSHYR